MQCMVFLSAVIIADSDHALAVLKLLSRVFALCHKNQADLVARLHQYHG